jgi:hypothetical protein
MHANVDGEEPAEHKRIAHRRTKTPTAINTRPSTKSGQRPASIEVAFQLARLNPPSIPPTTAASTTSRLQRSARLPLLLKWLWKRRAYSPNAKRPNSVQKATFAPGC